jgi:hypothetical protein
VVYESTDRSGSIDASESAILPWIVALVPNPIYKIDPNSVAAGKWVGQVRAYTHQHAMRFLISLQCSSKFSAILFTADYSNDSEFPLYWKALGIKYRGRLRLAVVRDNTNEIRKRLGGRKILYRVVLYRTDASTPPKRRVAGSWTAKTANYVRLNEAFEKLAPPS